MTDREIIKALRCCVDRACSECPYAWYVLCKNFILGAAAYRLEELTASRNVMKMREDA